MAEPRTHPNDYDWFQEFHAFTSFHYVVLGVCLCSFAVFCIAGRTMLKQDLANGTRREQTFRRVLAWSIIVSQAFFFLRRLTPEHWDLQDSLPMHMCRWTVWIAAWAMFSLNPKMRALLLFWGIGLSSQALFSPMINHGLNEPGFWIYWINHTQIIGAALYDLFVLGYRPKRNDLLFAIGCGVGYALFTIALNAILGTNYSYLGNGEHQASSIVDTLGPYPMRTVWMMLGGSVLMGLLYLFSRVMLTIRTKVFKKPAPRMFAASDFQPNTTQESS